MSEEYLVGDGVVELRYVEFDRFPNEVVLLETWARERSSGGTVRRVEGHPLDHYKGDVFMPVAEATVEAGQFPAPSLIVVFRLPAVAGEYEVGEWRIGWASGRQEGEITIPESVIAVVTEDAPGGVCPPYEPPDVAPGATAGPAASQAGT